jgi:hypothetical protein
MSSMTTTNKRKRTRQRESIGVAREDSGRVVFRLPSAEEGVAPE